MTISETLRAGGPQDILGFIPHSLGYWPRQSLVAITVQGKRLGATLRVDLPRGDECTEGPDATLSRFSETVRDYLLQDTAADASLLAIYSSDAWSSLSERLTGLLGSLSATLGAAGLPVRDAWFVGEERWRDAFCSDRVCCPSWGRPLSEISDSFLSAELILRGSRVDSGPDALVSPAATALPAEILAEERWLGDLRLREHSRPQFLAVLECWHRAMGDGAVLRHSRAGALHKEANIGAYLCATLRIPAWRDAILVMAAAGAGVALVGVQDFGLFDDETDVGQTLWPWSEKETEEPTVQEQAAKSPRTGNGGGKVSAGFSNALIAECGHCTPLRMRNSAPGYGEVLLGMAPSVPLWDHVEGLEAALEQCILRGTPEAKAAALTGKGWIEWCRGRGSYASVYLNRALVTEPGYRLAELLQDLVGRGTLCGWAGKPESAWQKFRPDPA